jgi:hypothetical protein
MLEKSGKRMILDKTPAYALVLPFLSRLYPRAGYIVLTRHPLAVLSSYAESFFEGDYEGAVGFNDILGRYVPAMAAFLRQGQVEFHHVRYEDLVTSPGKKLSEIFSFLGLPDEEGAVDYGAHEHADKSYGDPKVKHHTRPTTESLGKWAQELAADDRKLEVAKNVAAGLSEEDLAAWGYDKKTLFDPVAEAGGAPPAKNLKWKLDPYRLRRRIFLTLRKDIHKNHLGRFLRRVKYYCDVLLRD